MPRLIIDYEGMGVCSALWRVLAVCRRGRVSEAGGIKLFCWHTVFSDESTVSARNKKKATSADSFVVRKPANAKNKSDDS